MKGSLFKWLILLGTVAILGILSLQTYWVYRTWKLREAEFDQKVRASLFRSANNLAGLYNISLPSRELVQQVSTNYYIVNIDHAFEASDLEASLKYHLEAALLQEDFDYYVYDCSSDEMLYCNSISYDGRQGEILNLESANDQDLIYYFGVRFPERGGFILSSMDMSILFTVLLILAILFFAVAMFLIRKQNRLAQLQADFINNMTHEFKTPISTIKISNQVFLDHPQIQNDPRLLNYASIIAEQNERLDGQVEKILQIARVGKTSLRLNKEALHLHEMISGIVDSFEGRIAGSKGTFTLSLAAQEDRLIADKLHLQNIIFNLVDNALKYSGSAPQIWISTADKKNGLSLKIKDQGMGMAKEYLPKVFDRFYRIPTGNVHNVKGFGLGLYYVKKICENHGWVLNISSELHQGTEVSIFFKRP